MAALAISPAPSATPQSVAKSSNASVTVAQSCAASGTVSKSTTAAITVAPNSAATSIVWAHRFYRPDAILSMSGLSGSYTAIQDSPSSPDASQLSPTSGAVDVRFSFEGHGQTLRTTTNDQTIRVLVTAP